MARTASRSDPRAVRRITGSPWSRSRTARSSSSPSISGMEKSVTTASARSTSSRASGPELARSGSQPRPWTSSFRAASTERASSTSSTRGMTLPRGGPGQPHPHLGALAGLALVAQRPAVLGDDRARQHHPQAGALLPRREERGADAPKGLGGHAAAGVADHDLGPLLRRPHLHRHLPAGRGGLDG